MSRSRWLWIALAVLAGCGSTEPRTVSVAPPLAPPPADPDALNEEQVLELSRRAVDPEDAIRRIDSRPLSFPLDQAHLSALGAQGLDPDVLEYLERRARIDWAALRGDIPREDD